jgi:hypothetical protein
MTTKTAGTRKRAPRNPNARYEVWAGFPNPDRAGSSSQHSCRKFEWAADAWEYARNLPVDDRHVTVNITVFRAANGWRGDHIRQRRAGEWLGRDNAPLTDEQLADRKMSR